MDSDFSTIQDLYTDVEKNNGFLQSVKPFASYKNFPADEAPAQALGHFDKKGNRVVVFNSISRTDDLNAIGGKANAEANIRASYTVTLIHELFHVAKGKGGVSHKDIAKAMFDASLGLDGKTPVFKDNDGNDFSNPKKNKEENNSKYINAWINKYCPLPSK